MWELVGTGGTPGRTVKPEAYGLSPELLVEWVSTQGGLAHTIQHGLARPENVTVQSLRSTLPQLIVESLVALQ